MFSQSNASARVSAKVSVVPKLSQTVLVALSLISVIPMCVGFYFLWHGKEGAWVPFVIFLFLIAAVCVGWWRAQSLTDMFNANPTQISDKDGVIVTTDTRVFESSNAVAQLGTLIQSIGARNILPIPDGLVDSAGSPKENTQAQAIERVKEVNDAVKAEAQQLVSILSHRGAEAAQVAISYPEESIKGTLAHNKAGIEDTKQ